jgi:hypothetical protein
MKGREEVVDSLMQRHKVWHNADVPWVAVSFVVLWGLILNVIQLLPLQTVDGGDVTVIRKIMKAMTEDIEQQDKGYNTPKPRLTLPHLVSPRFSCLTCVLE